MKFAVVDLSIYDEHNVTRSMVNNDDFPIQGDFCPVELHLTDSTGIFSTMLSPYPMYIDLIDAVVYVCRVCQHQTCEGNASNHVYRQV